MTRVRFKSENKHVDAFDWHLSDGGSIPPASTKALNYNSLQRLSTFSFVDLSTREGLRGYRAPKITPAPAAKISFQDPRSLYMKEELICVKIETIELLDKIIGQNE